MGQRFLSLRSIFTNVTCTRNMTQIHRPTYLLRDVRWYRERWELIDFPLEIPTILCLYSHIYGHRNNFSLCSSHSTAFICNINPRTTISPYWLRQWRGRKKSHCRPLTRGTAGSSPTIVYPQRYVIILDSHCHLPLMATRKKSSLRSLIIPQFGTSHRRIHQFYGVRANTIQPL